MVDFDPSGLPRTPTILDTPPAGHKDANPAWSPDAFTFHGHSHGLIVFDRGSKLLWIDPNAKAPAAHPMKLKGFVAGANPDWQPRCSNHKPSGTAGKKIIGTQGPDLLCGGKGNDTIYGLGGDDRIFAGQGSDKVYAGPGNDFLLGGEGGGSNYLDGGPGNDHIEGSTGPDTIVDQGTGSGNDVIEAEDGNDVIRADDGVLGNDRVDGGFGTNTCYVDNPEGGGPPALDFVWNCENTVVSRPAVLPGP